MFSIFLKYFIVSLLCHCLYSAKYSDDEEPRIDIDNEEFKGSIVGKRLQDSNVTYIGFRGIPYAKPPINGLRFRDPQKLDKFEGILDATHDGYECYSVTARNASEDCLNLNVFIKQLNVTSFSSFSSSSPSSLLPVVVLIHPGGLYLGSGASFYMRPGHMMRQDLILVTFNHRLGALGFLNLGTAEIPGNAGFKDQVFALRWVQKYIKYFGGNPKDVTLMGYSAGGLSVQLHLISSLSKDLFSKAIIMSGSLAPQTFLPQQQKYLAVRLAKRLNCSQFMTIEEEIPYGIEGKFSDYEDIANEDILQCLNQHNGSVIGRHLRPMFDFFKDNPIILWLPVIEKDFQQERFLTENFTVQRKNVLIGYTNGELCLSAKDTLDSPSAKNRFSNEFDTLAPRIFMYERHPDRDAITQKIKQKYFNGNTNFTLSDYDAICDVFSDAVIRFGAHKFAQVLRQNDAMVYFYEFAFVEDDHEKDHGITQRPGEDRDHLQEVYLYILNNSTQRCEHMLDFQYLFNWSGRRHGTERQRKIVKLYTNFIYDFVKNGKLSDVQAIPYPESYVLINENIEFKEGHNFKNYKFWQNMFPKYFNYNF